MIQRRQPFASQGLDINPMAPPPPMQFAAPPPDNGMGNTMGNLASIFQMLRRPEEEEEGPAGEGIPTQRRKLPLEQLISMAGYGGINPGGGRM